MSDKVLISIVDDDRPFRESMRRLVRSLGHDADIFSSAPEFLASGRLGETACLVADVHMPAMSGPELHRHLLQSGRRIPTILVSAHPSDLQRAQALQAGVVCYLGKPIHEEDLSQCLRAAIAVAGTPADDS